MKTNYWEKFEEGCFYHIYNRGINGENLFVTDENKHFFLLRWKDLILPYFDIAAYCLMSNHFHFLARVKPCTEAIKEIITRELTRKSQKFLQNEISYNDFLEDQYKRLFTSYALSFNNQQNRTGSLFQKRFKRVTVKSEFRFWYLLAYIHHNPIHHRFCVNYEDWTYSSYTAFLSNLPTSVIRDEVLTKLDENDREKAIQLFLEHHQEFKIDEDFGSFHLE